MIREHGENVVKKDVIKRRRRVINIKNKERKKTKAKKKKNEKLNWE